MLRNALKSILAVLLAPLPVPVDPAHAGPGLHLRWRLGWVRGLVVRACLRWRAALGGTAFRAGRRLVVMGGLRIRGPGQVVLGDDVIIGDRTDLYTYARDSCISIGHRGYLNGTRFGCCVRIEIGDDAILADARIMDTDFHALGRNRRSKSATVATAPVTIGNNVWISAGAAILKGVTIGSDSVVAFGSVVAKDVPPGKLVAGNPAREIRDLPE